MLDDDNSLGWMDRRAFATELGCGAAVQYRATPETHVTCDIDVVRPRHDSVNLPLLRRRQATKTREVAESDAWQPLEGHLAILEVLEALFDHTHDVHYRDLILELAQRQQRVEERGYAYAFEAKYTRSKADQVRALAYTLYLDRRSLRIRSFSETQKREALAWWSEKRPY